MEEKVTRTKYLNQYRKDRFKQLNVDIPLQMMEDFETILKAKKTNKRQFIQKSIIDYINENIEILKK